MSTFLNFLLKKKRADVVSWLKYKVKIVNGEFITVWKRPVKAKDVHTRSYHKNEDKIGIVIQGGLYEDYDFTIETVKLYRRSYDNVEIIISTWDDAPIKQVNRIRRLGAEVILNKKPTAIPGNGNLEIVSTIAGIRKAREKGCIYVCKTRTDQRMYAKDVFKFLTTLISLFPIGKDVTSKGRIITLGSNTFRDRLYDINDMWNFGYAEDMECYWNCDPNINYDNIDRDIDKIAETYICSKYLTSIGKKLEWTVEDSIQCYLKYFIVVDLQSLDLYFVKRTKEYFNKSYLGEAHEEFSFRDWLAGQGNINIR